MLDSLAESWRLSTSQQLEQAVWPVRLALKLTGCANLMN